MMIWNSFLFNFPSSFMMEMITYFMDYVLMVLVFIFVLVFSNLVLSMKVKTVNSSILVNHYLEFVWSVLPFMILFFIAIPSLKVLYSLDSCIYCSMSIKILGQQWYWSYYYPNFKNFNFESYMTKDNVVFRLMELDNSLILPTNLPLRFLVSSNDVIHSWTVPSLGLKMDAVPGRINQLCISIKKVGKFFGQCSEICGANHSFMPIIVETMPFFNFF